MNRITLRPSWWRRALLRLAGCPDFGTLIAEHDLANREIRKLRQRVGELRSELILERVQNATAIRNLKKAYETIRKVGEN